MAIREIRVLELLLHAPPHHSMSALSVKENSVPNSRLTIMHRIALLAQLWLWKRDMFNRLEILAITHEGTIKGRTWRQRGRFVTGSENPSPRQRTNPIGWAMAAHSSPPNAWNMPIGHK